MINDKLEVNDIVLAPKEGEGRRKAIIQSINDGVAWVQFEDGTEKQIHVNHLINKKTMIPTPPLTRKQVNDVLTSSIVLSFRDKKAQEEPKTIISDKYEPISIDDVRNIINKSFEVKEPEYEIEFNGVKYPAWFQEADPEVNIPISAYNFEIDGKDYYMDVDGNIHDENGKKIGIGFLYADGRYIRITERD